MSKLTLYAICGVAVAAVVIGGIFAIYHKGEKAGAADVTVKVQKKTQETQQRINDAESKAPRTPHDVSKRMRDGTF